ncbi:hypothetical protein JAAARDRAFT_170491 [Jaapia argillacea MUCL 33604]|uniref:Methyltransferase domain-containing protein n=1 Tax=Jaapia argillacea MUCL 33604 TaxID=933084 RepID=A0A067Q7V1_9AGAM|nr:hypothetical protein JAAARDRAFT_170491 [Jaapia argillacea MUCL 33604]
MMDELSGFLADPLVSSLLGTHPNAVCHPRFAAPAEWESWWNWANDTDTPKWMSLLRHVHPPNASPPTSPIPPQLLSILESARRLPLPRTPIPIPPPSTLPNVLPTNSPHIPSGFYGMSPKKAHEVSRMVAYISHLLSSSPALSEVKHVVDVGSGQGYISRALRDTLNLHVLALDFNQAQTSGANKWDAKVHKKSLKQDHPSHSQGSLTHKTIHITPHTLKQSIHEWISSSSPNQHTPVLLIALHACGSLTPNILRTFIDHHHEPLDSRGGWTATAAVIVGCCYNLMAESDFPLSKSLHSSPQNPSLSLYSTTSPSSHSTTPSLVLTESHLNLATQTPSLWLSSPSHKHAAELAMRKVVWRALLGRWPGIGLVEGRKGDKDAEEKGEDRGPEPKARLGKLNDAAYTTWPTFLSIASSKMGFDPSSNTDQDQENENERRAMEARLEVLYTIRCLLGPVCESLILLDRERWVREELGERRMNVNLVNLFDQASGSARNVAIVITPRPSPSSST